MVLQPRIHTGWSPADLHRQFDSIWAGDLFRKLVGLWKQQNDCFLNDENLSLRLPSNSEGAQSTLFILETYRGISFLLFRN